MSEVSTGASGQTSVPERAASAERLFRESIILALMLLASLAVAVGERNNVISGGGYASSLLLLVLSLSYARHFRVQLPLVGQGAVAMLLWLAVPVTSIVVLVHYGLHPASPDPMWMPGWPAAVHLILLVPLAEELFFRGLLLDHLQRGLGTTLAVLLGSSLFALLHLPSGGVVAAGILGLLACLLVLRGGSLLLAVQVHMAWNGLTVVTRCEEDALRWKYALAAVAGIVAMTTFGWFYRAAFQKTPERHGNA